MCRRLLPLVAVVLLVGTACSGDDDTDDTALDTSAVAADTEAPTTTAAATTTTAAPSTTTTVALVTEGATVVVANSSIVGGAAGRMTEELASAGFAVGTATNGTDRLEVSVVYYTDDEGAAEVAESVAEVLGGVTAEALPDPIPTESGTLDGGQVLVMLGNEQADQTLEELSGTSADAGGSDEDAADDGAGAEVTVETSGSVVVVANANTVAGSAGAMTDELSAAGFEVGEATNGVEQLEVSVVYYTDADGAADDAEVLAETLGGLEVEAMPDTVPTQSGELDGAVLLLLGADLADQSLADIG